MDELSATRVPVLKVALDLPKGKRRNIGFINYTIERIRNIVASMFSYDVKDIEFFDLEDLSAEGCNNIKDISSRLASNVAQIVEADYVVTLRFPYELSRIYGYHQGNIDNRTLTNNVMSIKAEFYRATGGKSLVRDNIIDLDWTWVMCNEEMEYLNDQLKEYYNKEMAACDCPEACSNY